MLHVPKLKKNIPAILQHYNVHKLSCQQIHECIQTDVMNQSNQSLRCFILKEMKMVTLAIFNKLHYFTSLSLELFSVTCVYTKWLLRNWWSGYYEDCKSDNNIRIFLFTIHPEWFWSQAEFLAGHSPLISI